MGLACASSCFLLGAACVIGTFLHKPCPVYTNIYIGIVSWGSQPGSPESSQELWLQDS